MAMMILDPLIEERMRSELDGSDRDRRTEVWEGVTVVPPLPNDEHQEVLWNLAVPIHDAVVAAGLGVARHGVNVSDRDAGWSHNYRGPDLVVRLTGGRAVNHGTHWTGGPDFLVEVISPGEEPRAKFDFYARVGVQEVLIVDRDPWAVELHELRGGALVLAGRADTANGVEVTSSVLPLAFRLEAGTGRPVIRIRHTGTGQTWTV